MKGYKVFNPDWTCRGFQYEVGETYKMDGKPVLCNRGFHFCEKVADCFDYYSFDPMNKVAEVEALGEVVTAENGGKSCTNEIRIVREVSWEEMLTLANSGKGNTGNWNSGDWNKTNYCSGCFCTEEPNVLFFDKESDWTHDEWKRSVARSVLSTMPNYVTNTYIWFSDMTDEEKEEHPEAKVTDGYIKEIAATDADRQKWWDEFSDENKALILALPNFDAKKFKEITGVTV